MSDPIALVVVDAQRAFRLWEAAGKRRNNPDALDRIADLLALFRRTGQPIFHIRHENRSPGSSFHPDAEGYVVEEAAHEQGDEPVIVKGVNSSFIGTDLEARLRAAGIRRVAICGATTNHCVETTTRMAGNLGFDAVLVEDACWCFDLDGPDGRRHSAEDVQAMTLANLSGEFADIATAETMRVQLGSAD
ncbi:cysteine hydrolase family protein [Aureimonas sp. ME7]|uniref:cysteine hydrolase family protein n=1 Tax=Aureimonas sp. ME7 TaxID=2744252 RepID=UPI0015F3DDA9|nr:cysteine hydrolase family protein [Aureimonas sp. ME7]